MIIECIDKYDFEKEIEGIIYNNTNRGVKIVVQHGGDEIKELLVPYFDLLKDDCFTVVATFGANTPIFDIYDLYVVMTKYSRENALIINPDQSLNEEMVMLLIPLKRYYELMLQFDHKLEQLKTTHLYTRGERGD